MKNFTKILSLLLLTSFGLAIPSFAMQNGDEQPSRKREATSDRDDIKRARTTEGYQCPICCDTAEGSEEKPLLLISTRCCRQTIHVSCLAEWLDKIKENSCPSCPLCRTTFIKAQQLTHAQRSRLQRLFGGDMDTTLRNITAICYAASAIGFSYIMIFGDPEN